MAKHPNFRRKLVLITGAGAGIGRSTALAFAKRGANVVATDLRASALEEVKGAVEAPGVPDAFVNNAGIGHLGYFLESSLEHWPRVLNVNLMGVVNGCYYFIPKMIAAGSVGEAQRRRMQTYYEKKGATPDEIADAIVRAVERGADLINPGPNANLLYILRRISLKLARRVNYAAAPEAGLRA